MRVCRTDLATPTNEAVKAELTAAHRNCEKVRMPPDNTRMTKVAMKPSSGWKKNFTFINFFSKKNYS